MYNLINNKFLIVFFYFKVYKTFKFKDKYVLKKDKIKLGCIVFFIAEIFKINTKFLNNYFFLSCQQNTISLTNYFQVV